MAQAVTPVTQPKDSVPPLPDGGGHLRDPSGADAYLTFAQVDTVLVGLSVGVALLAWWLLRPSARAR